MYIKQTLIHTRFKKTNKTKKANATFLNHHFPPEKSDLETVEGAWPITNSAWLVAMCKVSNMIVFHGGHGISMRHETLEAA